MGGNERLISSHAHSEAAVPLTPKTSPSAFGEARKSSTRLDSSIEQPFYAFKVDVDLQRLLHRALNATYLRAAEVGAV